VRHCIAHHVNTTMETAFFAPGTLLDCSPILSVLPIAVAAV